jgi:hypothetical protein
MQPTPQTRLRTLTGNTSNFKIGDYRAPVRMAA